MDKAHRRHPHVHIPLRPEAIDLLLVGPVAFTSDSFRRVVRARHGLPPFDAPCVLVVAADLVERVSLARWRREHGAFAVAEVHDLSPRSLSATVRAGFDTVVRSPPTAAVFEPLVRAERAPLPGASHLDPVRLVGMSTALEDACADVVNAAASNASVLLTGESGVGKEVFAQLAHRLSPRRRSPFVAINCAAVPEALLESELFGHEPGAFTDARERRIGRFEQADGGTLFLDEIGELPLNMQAKLLRVLQSGSFERVGGSTSIRADARVITATNRNLEQCVQAGTFRADLYYRLCVLSISIPPLRERRSDILALWDHFVAELSQVENREPVSTDATVRRRLLAYDWPGNVRELQNMVRQALVLHPGCSISAEAVPRLCASTPGRTAAEVRIPGMSMAEIERIAILETYESAGSVKETARLLGIAERTIFSRLRRYREATQTSPIGRPRVFLVDDDEAMRTMLRDVLGDEFEVVVMSDGQALLLELDNSRPDIIVTDVRMPGLDGLELVAALNRRQLDVPVIVMTAFADEQMRREISASGANLIEKPFEAYRLAETMRELI